MEQVTQKLKNGQIQILQVPRPRVDTKQILVQNHFSCISAGTESSTVRAARKSYVGKIKERPAQARMVVEKLMNQGPWQTYLDVMKKLDAHSTLGYSSAGRVLEVGNDIRDVKVGDYVACGGSSACHAEWVVVPQNLFVKLNSDADLQQASYNTIGAIAMQGVRQLNRGLGETVAVIGLGLLGQVTCQLLRIAGIRVIGIDVDKDAVGRAAQASIDLALLRDDPGILDRIQTFTDGLGCDGVILTAATSSLDPINFAGAIARKKACIVVVGAVPTGFDREPHFYQKELTLKMSCSYGPGRYDRNYEEMGIDYPSAYVRWTERRNMQAFQNLISSGKLDLNFLTTHVFPLDEISSAYEMILNKSKSYLGVLVKYPLKESTSPLDRCLSMESSKRVAEDQIKAGFVGAGSYAQGHLLPKLVKNENVFLSGVATSTSAGARSVADRFDFSFCSCHADDILKSPEVNTVFIATRHDTHAKYVIDALSAGKHVFVEKPLCLKEEEIGEITSILNHSNTQEFSPVLMVGYNRRFSSLSKTIKEHLSPEPMSMVYRINAGAIGVDSWIQDPVIGGGRILGEVCHFVDYLTFINGSLPISVSAVAMQDNVCLGDTLSVSLQYANGSIGSIHYFSNGSQRLPKEYLEIYQSGQTIVLDDFRSLLLLSSHGRKKIKLRCQDKGQSEELVQFIGVIRQGSNHLIPVEELLNTSHVCFEIIRSLKTLTSAQ